MAKTRGTPNRSNKTSPMATKTAKKATKSPKKAGIKKKHGANSQVVKRHQYRSNLRGVVDLISKLNLTDEQKLAIKKLCPFWKIVKLICSNRLTTDTVTKGDNEIADLIGTFNKSTQKFHIGGKALKLTKEDVVKCFGVRGGKEKVFHSFDKCIKEDFYKNFLGLPRIRTAHISAALLKYVEQNDAKACENVAAVMTLYLLTSLFAPTGGATLSWKYNKILSEASTINQYDWPGYIFEKLTVSLKKDSVRQVTGCVMLIPIWIMEKLAFTEPREPKAKLWCEKWDLRILMALRTQGNISQVLSTQVSQSNDEENVGNDVGCNNDDEELDEAVDLGSDENPWGDLPSVESDSEKGENCTVEEENEVLRERIRIRDSHIEAHSKRNERLLKRYMYWEKREKLLLEQIKVKELCISELERQLLDFESSLKTKKKETEAVRRRLMRKNSEVEALEVDKLRLVDENTELVVQKFTQAACSEKPPLSSYEGRKLDFDVAETETNNVASVEGVRSGVSTRSKAEAFVAEEGKSSDLNENLDVNEPDNVGSKNSMTERLKKRSRQETTKRDSWVYEGEKGKGNQARKRNGTEALGGDNVPRQSLAVDAKPLTSFQARDDDFVKSPERKRVTKKYVQECISMKKMADAMYLPDDMCVKMLKIEEKLGKGCVVARVANYSGVNVLLDDLYDVLDAKMMSSPIINGHAQLLMQKFNTSERKVINCFDSNIWKFVKSMEKKSGDTDALNRKQFIDDVYQSSSRNGLYMFPITTNKGKRASAECKHWMLLTFDGQDQIWKLYNSLKGSGVGRNNPYLKDAKILKTYMERILRDDWRLSNEADMSHPNMIAVDNTQAHTFEVIEPPCQQQAADRNDCGTFVCYVMEKLANSEEVPSYLDRDTVLKYKAVLVQRFVELFDVRRLKK